MQGRPTRHITPTMGVAHPLDQCIKFFDKADGRDKLYKTLQNWFKVLAWRYTVLSLTAPNKERGPARKNAAMYRGLAASLSQFRSVQKFFKWLKTLKEVHLAVGDPSSMSPGDMVETASNLFDIGYKMCDNVEYLADRKVITSSAKEWETRSKSCQFWAYFLAVAYDILALTRAGALTQEEQSLSADERTQLRKARKTKLTLDFVKDFADFMRVASGRGYVTFVPAPVLPAFAGVMGTLSGAVGTYQV